MKFDPRVIPSILIALNILCALGYAFNGNYKQTIYWLAAATLTTTVTW